MFQMERQEKILEVVNARRIVRTKDLSDMLGTSTVTIRNDILDLALQGLLVKTHGGAISVQDKMNLEIPSGKKSHENIELKRRIGRVASSFIEPNDLIILDSGSTTLEIAKLIKEKNVTVITNDIKIAMVLAEKRNVKLVVTGGELKPSVHTLMGPDTLEFIRRVRVNKLFLGCDAFDVNCGISNRTLEEVAIKRAMMAASRSVIAVADSSKLGKQVFAQLCGPCEINTLIMDTMSQRDIDILSDGGVMVILAD